MDYKLAKLGCFFPLFPQIWMKTGSFLYMHLYGQFSIGLLYTLLHLDFVWDRVRITKQKPKDHPGWHSLNETIEST